MEFIKSSITIISSVLVLQTNAEQKKPNILFAIADDISYPYMSAYGTKCVVTPAFDLVANKGQLFSNAYVTSPGSSPSRASLLTGLYTWQIEEAGTHGSYFPSKYTTYPEILAKNGYHVGYTGKGWSPGNWERDREHNPAGDPLMHKSDKKENPLIDAYCDIDWSPSKAELQSKKTDKTIQPYFIHATAKRPSEELYDIKKDPGCMNNLIDDTKHKTIASSMRKELNKQLKDTKDTRLSNPEVWDTYPYLLKKDRLFPKN